MHFSSNILINYREKFQLENQNMTKMILNNISLWINPHLIPRYSSLDIINLSRSFGITN